MTYKTIYREIQKYYDLAHRDEEAFQAAIHYWTKREDFHLCLLNRGDIFMWLCCYAILHPKDQEGKALPYERCATTNCHECVTRFKCLCASIHNPLLPDISLVDAYSRLEKKGKK